MHFITVREQIKNRRSELNISQETLAELSGVGLRTLKEFERDRGNPTLQTISKLADALGLELCLQVKSTMLSE